MLALLRLRERGGGELSQGEAGPSRSSSLKHSSITSCCPVSTQVPSAFAGTAWSVVSLKFDGQSSVVAPPQAAAMSPLDTSAPPSRSALISEPHRTDLRLIFSSFDDLP
ncbi:MAG: hypothetical protein KIT72_11680 [Polyangiaceae bacterium]|nr:hypothetical protein [Polyangiaceae bacterium]MCW5791073.1 hypothetical protein [Polyangiaceae bacterium]